MYHTTGTHPVGYLQAIIHVVEFALGGKEEFKNALFSSMKQHEQ